MFNRIFFWGPQIGYSWPVKIVFGYEETGAPTVGLVTWLGSIFFIYGPPADVKMYYDPITSQMVFQKGSETLRFHVVESVAPLDLFEHHEGTTEELWEELKQCTLTKENS